MKHVLTTVQDNWFAFNCPACGVQHFFNSDELTHFNYDIINPTIAPTQLVNEGWVNKKMPVCEYILLNGFIHYGDKSTHKFKNKIVKL